VIPTRLLQTLVFGLCALIVAFGVFMGGHALATATENRDVPVASTVLWWLSMVCLLLLVIDLILLVVLLGVQALSEERREEDRENR